MKINKNHNTIYLIGNGFDLAHNLKTSYLDFFADVLINFQGLPSIIEDDRMAIVESLKKNPNYIGILDLVNSLENSFLKRVYERYRECNWMDVELFYFEELYAIVSNDGFSENQKNELITNHNKDFEAVTKLLYDYVLKINNNITFKIIDEIIRKKVFSYWSNEANYAINFNYTDTFKLYKREELINNPDIIHINGKVMEHPSSYNEGIIFGTGDEYSEKFNKIKESNLALTHFKSLQYSIRPEYWRIMDIITSPFNLIILGHSCGTPDRTLLSEIVNHNNLQKIIIHCKDREDNLKSLRYLKQSSKNGKIFVVDIEKGLCQQ